ncbi:hypothetical protein LY78DRAFT_178928 [Colletotrichum sublineola]|nr:hypothetical protein LY78DRAFT_178928 [Colletotrichum sublineola]
MAFADPFPHLPDVLMGPSPAQARSGKRLAYWRCRKSRIVQLMKAASRPTRCFSGTGIFPSVLAYVQPFFFSFFFFFITFSPSAGGLIPLSPKTKSKLLAVQIT